MMTETMIMLVLTGIGLRAIGALVRIDSHAALLRLAGWLICGIGVWIVAAAAGAWFPIWPIFAVAVPAGVVALATKQHAVLSRLTDAAIALMCGVFSLPPLNIAAVILLVMTAVLIGYACDRLPSMVPHRVRIASFGAPVLCIALAAVVMDKAISSSDFGAWHRSSVVTAANLGVTRSLHAQRVDLPNGCVGWLERPQRDTANANTVGAVVFHGNHQLGSFQPASVAIRRALLYAGYTVLSIDHPGYGASPLPQDPHEVDAWCAMAPVRAAFQYLRETAGAARIVVIGHSMGCMDVIRILAYGGNDAQADYAMVFGMGVYPERLSDELWVRSFNRARLLEADAISVELGAAIRTRCYDIERIITDLPPELPPVLFVRFGMEHADLVEGRIEAMQLLPHELETWDFVEATHYLSTSHRAGFIIGDVRVIRLLARRLRSIRDTHLRPMRHSRRRPKSQVASKPVAKRSSPEQPWQLQMFDYTLKKKQRLAVLRRMLDGTLKGKKCLLITCGDNNGAINYWLRALGGEWSWADCETKSIQEMTALLNQEVAHINPASLPYPDEAYDCIVTIDVHEHVQEPEVFTKELHRILKCNGRVIVTVPGGDQRKVCNRIKTIIGMTKDAYGHVRDGFSVEELQSLIGECNLEPRRTETFSRFFTEALELIINYAYVKKLSKRKSTNVENGTIAPATSEQLKAVDKSYRLYSKIYPLAWCISRLDVMLAFTRGYVVVVEGRKAAKA